MKFYKPSSSEKTDKMTCTLCQHYCSISLNKTGICGVNKNIGDKIQCLVYGYPAVINVDPIEKKPLYHFLPQSKTLSIGTVGCNFKCSFCQNHGISQEQKINKDKYYSPSDIVNMALNNKCDSIAYTYNEPTIFYPYIKDIAALAKKHGLKNVFVSNGFESHEVIHDMAGLIDAANIDLKSYDEVYYKKNLGGNLEKLKANLKLFKKLNIWIEITTLIIPDLNDSDEELTKIANFIANDLSITTPWHLSAFHPDYKMLDRPNTSVKSLENAYNIAQKAGLKYVYMGNANLENNSKCSRCNELFLQRITYKTTIDNRKYGVLCSKCNSKLDGVFKSERQMSVSSSFYSSSCSEIQKQLGQFDTLLENSSFDKTLPFVPKAIISPHAGFKYSGFTANAVYSTLQNVQAKTILVIGPSHKHRFKNASVSLFDDYCTPCGNIKIDLNYANYLKHKFDFIDFIPEVHTEHSTETQAPFIKSKFPNSKIVELIYGEITYDKISLVIDDILHNSNDIFIVISTDLSHFHSKSEANKFDNVCLEAIDKLDINIWNNGCQACGRTGVKALINSSNKFNLNSKLIDYRTSADVTGDNTKVVGYMSAVVG